MTKEQFAKIHPHRYPDKEISLTSNEQKLIDICFEIALTIKDQPKNFSKQTNNEEVASWVATQLRNNGFDTRPMGMSWGVLKS